MPTSLEPEHAGWLRLVTACLHLRRDSLSRAVRATAFARFGHIDEWHLVFPKAVQLLTFGLVTWLHETIKRFGSSLSSTRFKAFGPISDSVVGKRIFVVPVVAKMEKPCSSRKLAVMSEVTRLLDRIEQGDSYAAQQLMPLVYDELRSLAKQRLARESPGQTLDATALVHEVYLRLVGDQHFTNGRHFFAAAAEAMRRILVEAARRRGRLKRGGGRRREMVDLDSLATGIADEELLTLHEALERFAVHDRAKAQLVELRYFGGMSLPEVAEYLGISLSTAERGWRYARAWLYSAMSDEENSASE